MLRWSAFLIVLVGCGPTVAVQNPSPFDEDDPRARDARLLDEAEITKTTRQRVVRHQTGTIERGALVGILDKGLGEFLRRGVQVRPAFANKRFAGWEIVRFYPKDARFAEVDLRPGDVVTDVNRHAIERPKQAQVAWDSLRKASVVVVRGHRGGRAFELRYQIAGAGAPTP